MRAVPRVRTIVDPGWSTLWMKRFKPLRVGRRWFIVPPWSGERDAARLNLIIKPADAFGTGHHPSTAGVLRALEKLSATTRRFRSALDVGTGSGILAIAMTLMGVGDVVAIDTDAEAIRNARENAALNRLNHLDVAPKFSATSIESLRGHFDLIVANILASTLVEMAPRLKALLARDGRLILAGILARESESVLTHYRRALRCVAITKTRGWATLVLAP